MKHGIDLLFVSFAWLFIEFIDSQTLHGTAIYAYIGVVPEGFGLIGSPMAVPFVVSGIRGSIG